MTAPNWIDKAFADAEERVRKNTHPVEDPDYYTLFWIGNCLWLARNGLNRFMPDPPERVTYQPLGQLSRGSMIFYHFLRNHCAAPQQRPLLKTKRDVEHYVTTKIAARHQHTVSWDEQQASQDDPCDVCGVQRHEHGKQFEF